VITLIYKNYPNNPLKASRLGFGAWPLGNTARNHTMTKAEGTELVKEALNKGITFFDTAPNYALGKSETILGEALKDKREQVIINSKFGHHANDVQDFSETLIKDSVLGSLKRLKTTYLDSLILHNPPRYILEGKTNHFNVLESLKEEGLIKAYGVSIDTLDELKLALKLKGITVIEILLNLFSQDTRNLIEASDGHIAFIIKVPLDSGWLTGSYHKDMVFTGIKARWSIEDKKRRDDLVNMLKTKLNTEDLTFYALQFLFNTKNVTTVIPGIRTPNQLHEHITIEQQPFDLSVMADLVKFYDEFIKNDPLPW
jgi:aryl-alcohol dehydrogenase-like predicted oxidoreductase